MHFIRQVERLQLLCKLIEQGSTGRPVELADRLGIKERTLYDLLENMKSLGVEVHYDKKYKTYYYQPGHGLRLNFSLQIMKDETPEKIFGI